MAIDTTVTLKRLIAEFSEWATAHPMVNDFGYGQYLETFRSSENKYLALIINSPTATSEDFFINYSWEVICLDYVLDQNDNRDRVTSDTISVIRDLENTIRYSKRWKEFSRADGNWTYRKVDEFGADKCYGWIATFTLKIKKKHGICDIASLMPTYDFEVGQVVYPACDPVTFKINGTSEDSFASGSEFDLTLVDTDGNTPVYTYDDILKKLTVPASGGGGSTPVDVTVNGTLVYNQVTTNQALTVLDQADNQIGFLDGANVWLIENSLVTVFDTDNNILAEVSVLAFNSESTVISDCTQTVNGNAITNQLPETAKAFTIRYANNDPVVVTTITDNATTFVGEVPNPSVTYDLYLDGVDTGTDIVFDGTDVEIILN